MIDADSSNALEKAIAAFGSQGRMARHLGVSQPAVWGWLHKARSLPAEHVLAVEAATGISRHDLRPDIYPLESSAIRADIASALPPYADAPSSAHSPGHSVAAEGDIPADECNPSAGNPLLPQSPGTRPADAPSGRLADALDGARSPDLAA